MNRSIKWEKLVNPLISVDEEGEENTDSKVIIQVTPFGPAGYKLNPDFPQEQAYTGHTNFDISTDIARAIEEIDGVEALHVLSPYRFRLIVGKKFNGQRVRRKIKERLCYDKDIYVGNIEQDVNLYRETLRLRSQDKPWGVYILPNGSFETVIADSEDDLEKKLIPYGIIRDRIGGAIVSS